MELDLEERNIAEFEVSYPVMKNTTTVTDWCRPSLQMIAAISHRQQLYDRLPAYCGPTAQQPNGSNGRGRARRINGSSSAKADFGVDFAEWPMLIRFPTMRTYAICTRIEC